MCTRIKKTWKYIFCYLIIVSVFALINWGVFYFDTTSFLVSEQMNKHLARYDLVSKEFNLASFHAEAKDLMPVSVDGFVGGISTKLMRLSEVNDSILVHGRQIDSLQRKEESLRSVAVDHRDSNVNAYLEKAMCPYIHQLDSLEQIITGMDSTKAIYDGLLIEKTQLEVDYAVKNKEVLDYVFRNLQLFIPLEERDLLNDYSSKIVSSTVEKNSLELERFELVRSIRKSVSSFHDNRRSSVGFLDFVYYSFCVSTTVSFGDIAPNNGWTRFIAILELLSCIVLVHFILTGMTKKENE